MLFREFGFIVLLSVLFVSCKDEPYELIKITNKRSTGEYIDTVKDKQSTDEVRSAQRSRSEAIAIAAELFSTEHEKVRSDAFEIEGVLATRDIKLRDGNTARIRPVDTAFYVLRRRNNKGFALIAGDKSKTICWLIQRVDQ